MTKQDRELLEDVRAVLIEAICDLTDYFVIKRTREVLARVEGVLK